MKAVLICQAEVNPFTFADCPVLNDQELLTIDFSPARTISPGWLLT
jgi:hypothetical protein